MRTLKRIIIASILAVTLLLNVSLGKEAPIADEPEVKPPEASPISPVTYDDSAELAELERRKQAHLSEVSRIARAKAAERQAEVTRKHHIAIEVRRIAKAKADAKRIAEAERKRAILAKKVASKPKQPSRSDSYVGKAQSYEATFYTAFCPTGCVGVTASGYDVSSTIYYDGMRILAAPKSVPMYSIMRVTLANGSTFDGIVLDRGGSIVSGRLDILVKTRQEAYVLGRQPVEVRMIRKGR